MKRLVFPAGVVQIAADTALLHVQLSGLLQTQDVVAAVDWMMTQRCELPRLWVIDAAAALWPDRDERALDLLTPCGVLGGGQECPSVYALRVPAPVLDWYRAYAMRRLGDGVLMGAFAGQDEAIEWGLARARVVSGQRHRLWMMRDRSGVSVDCPVVGGSLQSRTPSLAGLGLVSHPASGPGRQPSGTLRQLMWERAG